MANTLTRDNDFFAGDPNNRGGIRVSAKNLDDDEFDDLFTGAGTGGGSQVTGYAGAKLRAATVEPLFAFESIAGFAGGVFVG